MKINSKMFVNGNIINIAPSNNKNLKDKTQKLKPILEKTLDSKNLTALAINSLDANVYLSSEDTNELTVRVYGYNSIDFDISVSSFTPGLARIIVKKPDNNSFKNNYKIITDNSFKIEVIIPNKLFDSILINSKNGNITIDSSIKCRNLELASTNGNMTTNCPFERTTINSINGNVTMQICATSNCEIHIYNTNGNSNITLSNFGKNNIRVSQINGLSKNIYYPSGQYHIWGSVYSTNGNIYIK